MQTKLVLEALQFRIDTVNLFGGQKSTHFTILGQNRLTSSKLMGKWAWESIAKLSWFSSNCALTLDGDGECSTVGSETSRQGKQGEQERGLRTAIRGGCLHCRVPPHSFQIGSTGLIGPDSAVPNQAKLSLKHTGVVCLVVDC